MIRGTEAQISQIRGMLEKMGEVLPGQRRSDAGRPSADADAERFQRPRRPGTNPGDLADPAAEQDTHRRARRRRLTNNREARSCREGIPPELLERLRELKRPGELPPKARRAGRETIGRQQAAAATEPEDAADRPSTRRDSSRGSDRCACTSPSSGLPCRPSRLRRRRSS